MDFKKETIIEIILNTYSQSWFIWIVFLLIGLILFIYSDNIGTHYRNRRKNEDAGAGLIALSIVVHLVVIWAYLNN